MLKKILRILLKIFLWFLSLSILTVIIYRFVPPPITPLMLQRLVEQKMDGKDFTLKKELLSLDEISPSLPLAVITSEDQKFEEHFGFDLQAIEKAQKYNERHKGKKTKAQ